MTRGLQISVRVDGACSGLGVSFLRIALKNVKTPTADITVRLFNFLIEIRAIRKEGAKGLYKAYLRWVAEGETSQEIHAWNDSIDIFECSWHSSQEEQNHMLAEAGKINEQDASSEIPASHGLQSCRGNPRASPRPIPLNLDHYSHSSKTRVEAALFAIALCHTLCVTGFAANSHDALDLQQAQVNVLPGNVIFSTPL